MSETTGHPDERPRWERPEDGHVGDLVTPYALGALEPAERAWAEEHRRGCPACDRLLAAEERFVTLLPFAVRATPPPPPDVKAALLARVAHAQRARTADAPSAPDVTTLALPASRPALPAAAPLPAPHAVASRPASLPRWGSRWVTALLVVPLFLMLAGTGAWAAQLRAQADERGDRADGFGQMLERALNGDGTRHELLPGPAAPEAKGWVVTQPGGNLATLFLRNPDARAGQRYQVFVTRKGPPVLLVDIELDERGRGVAEFELDLASAEYRQFRLKLVVDDGAGSDPAGLALFGRVEGPAAPPGGGSADAPTGGPSPRDGTGDATPQAAGTGVGGGSTDSPRAR